MPAAAIPTWALITSAIAPAAASIAGSAMQSRAAGGAARRQTDAANHAADVQAAAMREAAEREDRRAAEALAFQRQTAQNAYANSEATRRANYEQWVARERRLASVGEALGYGSRDIPAYVPGVDPRFDAAPAPMSAPPVGVGGNQGQIGHITKGGTVPLGPLNGGINPNGMYSGTGLPSYAPGTGADGLPRTPYTPAPYMPQASRVAMASGEPIPDPGPGSVGAYLMRGRRG